MEWATADLRCAAEPRAEVQFSSELALPPRGRPRNPGKSSVAATSLCL